MEQFLQDIDTLDALPLEAEGHFQASLKQLLARRPPSPEPTQWARYARYRARLSEMAGHSDTLDWARRSLEAAAAHQQWSELEATTDFLRGLIGSQPDVRVNQPGLTVLTEAVVKLASCHALSELRRTHLELLLEHTSLPAASWHELEGGRWVARDWRPAGPMPPFRPTLLDRCAESGQPLASELLASHSETAAVLAVPVARAGKTVAVLSCTGPYPKEMRLIELFSSLSCVIFERIQAADRRAQMRERTERLHRRWQEILQLSPAGLALLNQQGDIVQANPAYQQLLPGPLPIQEGSRLIEQRLPAPRWLQVNDCPLPMRGSTMRTVVDLSGQEASRWLRFLEEGRHILASDIHDGPCQLAAVANLQQGTADSQSILQTVLRRMAALRSPWVEGKAPGSLLVAYAQTLLPHPCRLDIRWQLSEAQSETDRATTSYRVVQCLLESLSRSWDLTSVHGLIQPQGLTLEWQGSPRAATTLDALTWDWLRARLELVDGHLESTPQTFGVTYE